MSNERNWSLLFLLRCRFLIRFSFVFVLFFHCIGIVSFVTNILDRFQLQSRVRLSQINIIVLIRLKFNLYAVFMKSSSSIRFFFVRRWSIVTYWDFLSKISWNCYKKVGTESSLTWVLRNVSSNVYLRPTALIRRVCWNDTADSPSLAITFQLFSQNLSSRTLCSCLEIHSTTNNFCSFWRSKFQQVSTYAFCSWVDKFTQKIIQSLVQVHRIPVLIADQCLYRIESVPVLKLPSWKVF